MKLFLFFWLFHSAPLLMGGGMTEAGQGLTLVPFSPVPPPGFWFTANFKPSSNEGWLIGQEVATPHVVDLNTMAVRTVNATGEFPTFTINMGAGQSILGDLIYNVNGLNFPNANTNNLHVFDTNTYEWTQLPDAPTDLTRSGTTLITANGKLYVFGGYGPNHRSDLYEYDPSTQAWTFRGDSAGVGTAFASGTKLGDFLFFYGGETTNSEKINHVLRFSLNTSQWDTVQPTGPSLFEVIFHKMFADEERKCVWTVSGFTEGVPQDVAHRLCFETEDDLSPRVEEFHYDSDTLTALFVHSERRRVYVATAEEFGELRLVCNYPSGCPVITTPLTCPPSQPYRCSSEFCTEDPNHCDTLTTSAPNRVLCFNGEGGSSCSDCMDKTTAPCPSSKLTCCDGSCKDNWNECPSTTCSWRYPVRCWDGTCAASLSACGTTVSCTEGKVMCSDGVCRSNCDSFQGLTLCPPGTQMCWNLKCSPNCGKPPACGSGKVLCWDASCASGLSRCPPPLITIKTAPISGHLHHSEDFMILPLKDWNGARTFGQVTVDTAALSANTTVNVGPVSFIPIRPENPFIHEGASCRVVGPCFHFFATEELNLPPGQSVASITLEFLFSQQTFANMLQLAVLEESGSWHLLTTSNTVTPQTTSLFSVQLSAQTNSFGSICAISSFFCGDAIVNEGEGCDRGAPLNSDSSPLQCRSDCTKCGDGIVDSELHGELCDDGIVGGLCLKWQCTCPSSCPSSALTIMAILQRCDCYCPAGKVRDGSECRAPTKPPTNPSTEDCDSGAITSCVGEVLVVLPPPSPSDEGVSSNVTVFDKRTLDDVLVVEVKDQKQAVWLQIKPVKEEDRPNVPEDTEVIAEVVQLQLLFGNIEDEEDSSSSTEEGDEDGVEEEEEARQVIALKFRLGSSKDFQGVLRHNQMAFLGFSFPSSASLPRDRTRQASNQEFWQFHSSAMALTTSNDDILYASAEVDKTNNEDEHGGTLYTVILGYSAEGDDEDSPLAIIIGVSIGTAGLIVVLVSVAGGFYASHKRKRERKRVAKKLKGEGVEDSL
ncbi:PA14 domain-containing protein [Balamuthia mandrillaris]